jgi:hypothetical protein
VIPEGIVDSLWYDVSDRCREFGDAFDAWQDGLGEVSLGLRADGQFAATVGGITYSIPRQVAKTFIVMRIVVALCTLFPDLTVIWTAHRMRTATNTFQKMKAFVLRPGVRPYLKAGANNGTAIRDANGEQEIPFTNGSRILFGAREQGFGRGFDEVDVEVFDEAQILTVKALEDMVAATNQSRFEHGALLFYMGTPPRPRVDPGEVFAERRAEALAAKESAGGVNFGSPVQAGDAVYVECSGDPDGDPDDPRQVERANPSYPHRTPPVSVKRLRKNLPDRDSWRREGLGIWDDLSADRGPFPAGQWLAGTDASSSLPEVARLSFCLDISADRTHSHIAVAGSREDGLLHVEVAASRAGTDWPVRWFEERASVESPMTVVVQERGAPASSLLDELDAIDHLTVVKWGGADLGNATARLYDLVTKSGLWHADGDAPCTDGKCQRDHERRGLAHLPQPVLDVAAATAVPKILTDGGMAWDRRKSPTDIAPLVAVTGALWHALQREAPEYRSVYEDRGLMTIDL